MESKSAFGNTKRRKYIESFYTDRKDMLSNRITRLSKQMKAVNPSHLYVTALNGLASFSTTGGLLDLAQAITQGDAYNQRYGNKIIPKTMILRGSIQPGTTGTAPPMCRIACVRATSALAAYNFNQASINPIADNSILQVTRVLFGLSLTLVVGYIGILGSCVFGSCQYSSFC